MIKKLAILGAVVMFGTAGLFGASAFAGGESTCPLAGTPDCPLTQQANCCIGE